MKTSSQKGPEHFGLGPLPDGVYLLSASDAEKEPSLRGQLHHIRRAFDAVKVDGILCVDARPTVYFKDYATPLDREEVNLRHKLCWNQGIATVLVLRDPQRIYIFSGLIKPNNDTAKPISEHGAYIESLELVARVLEAHHLVENIASGHYYRSHQSFFFERSRTVDQFLVKMLSELSSHLNSGEKKENLRPIHAFLGRLIFTCYLVDRGIIRLSDYGFIRKQNIEKVQDIFEHYGPEESLNILFDKLFPSLKKEFNGSTFEANLEQERSLLQADKVPLLRRFFKGEDLDSPQQSLGFWAFDFSVIPVETISAIYEHFLEREDTQDKTAKGAFYTPRYLAEMVIAEALDGCDSLLSKRFLDPSCGSGIFLVVIFNRLAEEWKLQNKNTETAECIEALVGLFQNLRGIDVNETACRITCFSLYIAFLDQFSPPILRELKEKAGCGQRKPLLPPLLAYKADRYNTIPAPVIFEGNYFDTSVPLGAGFDFIIGNPPWVSRQAVGTEVTAWMESDACPVKGKNIAFTQDQIALAFLWKIPSDLTSTGNGCLILPSQILLNKTDDFQKEWFRRHKVARLLHLADYRRFLFENAIRPCFILHFQKCEPEPNATIEYVVPKVMRMDPRSGLIPVIAEDRRFIRLEELLDNAKDEKAAFLWKTYLWGTPRDLRLIEALMTFPSLGARAGKPEEQDKRFHCSKGFQPWYDIAARRNPKKYGSPKPLPRPVSHPSIGELDEDQTLLGVQSDTSSLDHLLQAQRYSGPIESGTPEEQLTASRSQLRRGLSDQLCRKPLVLVSKGFGKVAFFDFDVAYKDPLTGINGEEKDADLLLFLTVYLRSKLAWYLVFHTAGSLGAERNEVRLHELLRLPFPLPEDDEAIDDAAKIVKRVATAARKTHSEIEKIYEKNRNRLHLHSQSIAEQRRTLIDNLQDHLEPLVYQYFGLTADDIALVEDTYSVYWPSATPNTLSTDIATLRRTKSEDLQQFSEWLCRVLNEWVSVSVTKDFKPKCYFNAEYTSLPDAGLCMVTLHRGKTAAHVQSATDTSARDTALARIAQASRQNRGNFTYLRNIIHSTADAIYIVRPNLLGQWTRSAALNTADVIFGAIANANSNKRNG